MANEGSSPDFDIKIPSLDLPEPTGLEGLDSSPAVGMEDLKLDAPLDLPGSEAAPAAGAAEDKKGKMADKKAKNEKKKRVEKPPKASKPKRAGPKSPKLSSGAMLPLMLNVFSVILLLFVGVIMYLFDVPLNQVPDLSLTTYVESLWLFLGCLFFVAILQDVRTALMLTGINLAMLATVFPTLWLLLDTPMNPLYFYIAGMIVLIALVVLPMNLSKAQKTASVKAASANSSSSAMPAAASSSTGPRTAS